MVATVHHLHPPSPPLAGFLRFGHTGQRKLEALLAAGRFPYRRVVFDAAHLAQQLGLLARLRASGCEIVLDPNFAEMATEGAFRSGVSRLPWANQERPWRPDDFGPQRNANLANLIAQFAVQHGTKAVLAPTHLLETAGDRWRSVDFSFCELLRHELDTLGGQSIAIDYQLITTNAVLRDEQQRRQVVVGITDLPIENVWLRVSGFGATSTGAGTRHFIEAVADLHQFELPFVADCAGGFAALAALAFGAVGGICHGVGQKEGFRASDWKKPPGGGGSKRRIYIPELDRHFPEDQLNAIFAARFGRSRFGCNDTSCCLHGTDDMTENPHAHFITQRNRQLESLSVIPDPRRAEHFLLQQLEPAVRSARLGAKLKIADDDTRRLVDDARKRLTALRDTLDDLESGGGIATRSPPVAFRGGGGAVSAMLGR
jgi:hypothetical protein